MRHKIMHGIGVLAGTGTVLALTLGASGSAWGYQPAPSTAFSAANPSDCNKNPCVLYPKTAQLPGGRLIMTFEDSQGDPVGQNIPVYASDDDGDTWFELSSIAPPAELSDDPQFAPYTSAWTNAHPYVLQNDVGDLSAGTLLVAAVVSGDDAFYREHKDADSEWQAGKDGDRADVAIAVFASTDDGSSWRVTSIAVDGGWQGGSAGASGVNVSQANSYSQSDPVWEPHLMEYNGTIVCYYSDERDIAGIDAETGAIDVAADDATAPDTYTQILAHTTWDGRAESWSTPVVDVSGTTITREDGSTVLGGGRPGMTTVVPTTDGRWMMTYEWWGGGADVRYKIADDPLSFRDAQGTDDGAITDLPALPGTLATGGSPVLSLGADGEILYNSAGSSSLWVNESGRSDGEWKQYQTAISSGYSRNLHYLPETGQILITQADWGGSTITTGHVDIGSSSGDYVRLVNAATGQVLSTEDGKTQDANLTGDTADIVTEQAAEDDLTQWWHLVSKDEHTTLLNKSGGRALAIWRGLVEEGSHLAQWVDDDASDKRWVLTEAKDGTVTISPSSDPSLAITATGSEVTLAPVDSSSPSQKWTIETSAAAENPDEEDPQTPAPGDGNDGSEETSNPRSETPDAASPSGDGAGDSRYGADAVSQTSGTSALPYTGTNVALPIGLAAALLALGLALSIRSRRRAR